jgi:uncharacterized protein with beta-barrel porin domain
MYSNRKEMLKARLLQSAAMVIVVTTGASVGAQAQTVTVTAANANVLNLLSPFLSLNSTAIGQQTLQTNLSQAIAVNNGYALTFSNGVVSNTKLSASQYSAAQALAESDVNLLSSASNSVTGLAGNYGVAANLAGSIPNQAPIAGGAGSTIGTSGTVTPSQPIGGLGGVLGTIYATGVNAYANGNHAILPNTVSLLTKAYNFTSTDLGVAKNYFADGQSNPSGSTVTTNNMTYVAPAGYTLPTFNGLPNTNTSVYDTAYGVSNTGTNQNIYGDSRPFQVSPGGINLFDSGAPSGLTTNPSFPSGHTNYAFTDSILIGMLVPSEFTSMMNRAAAYSNSRIVLGVHYPLDIIASRSFASYDLSQAFTNSTYINNATTTGTALNLPSLFNAANAELSPYLASNCGAAVATCAASAANNANNPYTDSAASLATYTAQLTYGLPTLSFAQGPREQAPAGGPDASILLAPMFGGSTSAAQTIAPNGGIYGSLQTSTINQILVGTETNALSAFYGTSLSYWSRINLVAAADFFEGIDNFQGAPVTVALASTDMVTTPVSIVASETLGGTGTIIGNTTVQSSGTFAPGLYTAGVATGPGTFKINGSLTFNSGSTYGVQVASTGASTANVSGAATLGGAGVTVTGSISNQKYTILTAGSLNGTFGALTNSNIVNTISYDPTHAYLTISGINFAGSGGTSQNQQNVGNGLNSYLASGGSLPASYANLTPAQQTQVAGQATTGTQGASFSAMEEFSSLLTSGSGIGGAGETGEPLAYAGDGERSNAAFEAVDADLGPAKIAKLAPVLDPHWAVWGAGFGGGGTVTGNANAGSNAVTSHIYGGAAGADTYLSPTTTLGFGIAGGSTNYGIASGLGSGKSDLFQVGVAGTQRINQAYLTGAFAYGWQDVTTNRTVQTTTTDNLQGRFRVNSLSERAEFGNRWDYQTIGVTPFLAGQLTTLFLPSYSETATSGTTNFALNYGSKTVTDPRTELGLRFDKSYDLQDGSVTLKSSVAYVYDYNTRRNINATFQSLPGASFTVGGAQPAPNGALVTTGADFKWKNGWSVGAAFQGEFSANTADYEGKGVVKYEW